MYKYVKDKTEQKYFETVCDNTNDSSFEYVDVEQSEVDGKWYLPEECPHLTPEEKRQEERDRLDNLFMTRSDFFDGFIIAFNLGQAELRAIVENILNSINITDVQIKVALNNFDNALNFYRKHTLFTLLNNVEIHINEDFTLLFTSDIWDKFFDTKDYKELQKAIVVKSESKTTENENEQ